MYRSLAASLFTTDGKTTRMRVEWWRLPDSKYPSLVWAGDWDAVPQDEDEALLLMARALKRIVEQGYAD